jgi:hypothetical protein
MLLRMEKAGSSGSRLKRLYALISPLAVQRGLKEAGLPANLVGNLGYVISADSIQRERMAAMRPLKSYVEVFTHLT